MSVNIFNDERRTLTEWIADAPIRACKVLEATAECEVGNHYHLNKDEHFYLISGAFLEILLKSPDGFSQTVLYNIPAPYYIYVPRGTFHRFKLQKQSILLGAASEPFDETDEIRL